MGILNHKRIICSYIAMAMVFTQVVPTGWSEGPTLQQELEKTVFIQTLEAANAEKSETLKQSNNDTTSFFDQDGALTAVNDNKMPNEEDMLQGMPGDKTENDGKIDADQESVMLPEVMVGMFEKADGTIDAAVRDRLMKDIEKNHPHLVANIWIDGLLVSGFESDEQLEAFIVEMRNRKDVEYAERNRIQEIQLYDSLPFKFTPQAEVAFPDQIIIDGEKVKMDVEYFVDVLKIMMNKARRDSGFICDEGCGTAADLFLLKGINQVFSLKDLQKFDAFNEMPGVTMPNFTNEGWIDFTTELLSKYKKADLDIFEGMIIASKSMIMAGSKFSFGTTVTQSYISGYSEISLLKKPEVILRTISAEKVWALIKNGADVLENSKLPEDALLALATHLGVKTEDIVDLNVFYDNYQWFVDGNYPKNGVIQHFAGMIEDRFIPLEAAISIPRYVTEAPTMFEGNPSELIQFDEAIQQVYGLPMPKKPLLARFYVSVVDTDADINAEAALAISNELGMDLNSLNRISAESTYVCMAMNVCPTKAWNISVDAKDGFIYKGSLSYYPNRKEAYRVNITEVIPAINPSEKAILESLSKTFDLSFDDLKGLVKFQTLKDGSINVYFAKTKHTMGDERILNVLGSNALPSFANFKVLVTLCKPSPGFSCEGSTQVVSARMEWAEENGKMPNAVIDFVDQGRIDRVQWFVDEKTPMSRQVCGGDVCWMETVEGTLTHMGDIHVYHWGKDNALKIEVRSSLLYVRQEGPHTMDMKMDGNGEFVDQVGVQFYPLPVPRDLGLKGVITFHFDGQNHYIDKFLEYENGELVSTSIFQWLITPDRIAYCLPAPGYSCEHDVQKGEKKLTGIERLDANGKTISTISAANPAARYIQMPSLGQSGTAYVFITGDKEYSREVNYKNFEDLLAQVKQLEESISKLSPVEKAVIEKLSEVLDIPFDTLKDMVKTRVSQDKADFGTIYVSFISGDAMMGIDRTIDPTGENNLPSSVSFKIHTEQFCTTGMPANCGASYTFESMNINWNSVVDNVQLNKIAEVSFDLEGRVLRSFWTTTRQGIDNCTGPVCTTQAFPLISDFAFIDFYDYDKAGVVITRSNSQFYLWSQPSTMPVVDGKPYDPYPRSNPNQTIQMKVYMQKAMDNQGYFVNKVEEFKDGVVIATSDFTYMTNVEFPKCAPGEICVQGGRETHKQLVSVTRTSLPANFKTQAEIRDGNIAVISIRDYQEKIQFNSLDGLLKAMARIEEEHGQSEIPAREAILNSLTQTFGYSLKEAEELLKNARIEEGLVDENGKPMISLGGTFRIILSPKNGTGSLSNVLFPLDEAGHPKSIVYTIVRNELPAAPCAVNADGTLMGNCPMGGVNDTIQKATISFENHRSEVKFSNNQAVSAVNSMRDPFAVCIQSPCDVFVKLNQMNFNYDANGQLSGVAIYHNNENTSVGKFVNPSKSYVDFVKYGSRFYVNKVSDSYAGDERISEFQYLIAMADIMCVQGSICESPEPFVSLNQISRHRLIPGTSDKIEELSTIYDGVITFLKKKEKTKGSFREQLNQAKVFEDSILKQGGVFQKMQNVLAEIQGLLISIMLLKESFHPSVLSFQI
jgi:hypothetical protein